MKWIVDRIEENIVVCESEDKEMKSFLIHDFSEEVKEGDVVMQENGKMKVQHKETEKRKKEMQEKFRNLLKKR